MKNSPLRSHTSFQPFCELQFPDSPEATISFQVAPRRPVVECLHSISTLDNLYCLIRFIFFQASSSPLFHSELTQLVVGDHEVISEPNTMALILSFSSRFLIIFIVNILSSVSTNCSRASFWVGVYPTYSFFLSLLIEVHV